MNKVNLCISGFKRFGKTETFSLNNLTLLTGANSAGKSSVIQSLLLAKLVAENSAEECLLDLGCPKYALDLGSYDDILNHASADGVITVSLEGFVVRIPADQEDQGSSVRCIKEGAGDSLFSQGFCYLCAERLGPRYLYRRGSSSAGGCGCHGESAGDFIVRHLMDSTEKERSIGYAEGNKWQVQFDQWVDYIFPGVSVGVCSAGPDFYQVKVHGDAATNVGFGITYALPIIASALAAKKEGWLLVENPEAHLHPKAQSNMGYFLGRMAAAGVRVVVETHSEHVVNGIRRAVVESANTLKPEDVTIYFFKPTKEASAAVPITIDGRGNLSDFPKDFFDQSRQDLMEIIDTARKNASL